MNRLLGCWPVDDSLTIRQARLQAVGELARMCGDFDVMPTGSASVGVFSDRRDVLAAAAAVAVPLPRLLGLAERLKFKAGRVFVCAAVDVRPADLAEKVAA